MKDLDALLGQDEPERRKTVVHNELDSLHITNYAFEKAYAYARLAVRKARRTIECGGYLIAPKDSQDRIATDSYLARNQDVSDGLFTVEAEDVIKAGREINEMGYKVLGWWHSHGKLRTFFSPTDVNGQITVLNEIGAFNYVTEMEEKEVGNLEVRIDTNKVIMFDRRNPGRKYEIEVDGDPNKLSIAKLKLRQEKRRGFAYGLVVNNKVNKKEPYAEIATRDLCGFCRNSKDKSVSVDVTLFDAGSFEIDDSVLMAEIDERVRMKPKFIRSIYFGKGKSLIEQGSSVPKWISPSNFGGYYSGYRPLENDTPSPPPQLEPIFPLFLPHDPIVPISPNEKPGTVDPENKDSSNGEAEGRNSEEENGGN